MPFSIQNYKSFMIKNTPRQTSKNTWLIIIEINTRKWVSSSRTPTLAETIKNEKRYYISIISFPLFMNNWWPSSNSKNNSTQNTSLYSWNNWSSTLLIKLLKIILSWAKFLKRKIKSLKPRKFWGMLWIDHAPILSSSKSRWIILKLCSIMSQIKQERKTN